MNELIIKENNESVKSFFLSLERITSSLKRVFTNLVLMFVFGLLSMPQNVYAQDTQSNSELGIFLKTKGYTPIKLNKFPTGHLYLTTEE